MRREPVTIAGGIIILVKALIAWLSIMGIVDLSDAQQQASVALAVAVVDVGTVIVALAWARLQTTSLNEPRDRDGAPLGRMDGRPRR